jgi:hypothetical protein
MKLLIVGHGIARVAARGYFVTTPDKYFPLEQHSLLPFYQFLPVTMQRRVASHSPGYLAEYEAKYTAERNYRLLMSIYERVLASRR